ncbi:substrate-binding periplasmic protein [Kordiimonas aquimaris]|uniref:substrate-binding periplasmic protein n=1 Tax=Kordiimonas aquimaris TaxID=707591 RepID=UPI0021D2EFA0|nr:transporter substrate-binding domain-containing protein [Kordiimonas aquimaris]
MKHFIAALLILYTAAMCNTAVAQKDTLKVITYTDFPPFVTNELPGGGIINEIVKASFAAADIELEIEFIPWKRSYRAIARGEFLASFSWAYSDDRAKDFHFSDPLFVVTNRLLTTLPELSSWEMLAQEHTSDDLIILCAPIGWKIAEELEALIDKNFITLMAPSRPQSCIELIHAGRTDLIYMPQITATYHLNSAKKQDTAHPDRPWPTINSVDIPSGNNNTQHVIFTKNAEGLSYKKRFDTGLRKIVADGTYAEILLRFLSNVPEAERLRIMQDQRDADIIPAIE